MRHILPAYGAFYPDYEGSSNRRQAICRLCQKPIEKGMGVPYLLWHTGGYRHKPKWMHSECHKLFQETRERMGLDRVWKSVLVVRDAIATEAADATPAD